MHFQVIGVQTHALGTVEAHRADVGAGQLVLAHHVELRLAHRVVLEGDLHAEDLGRVDTAVGVLVEAENRRAALGRIGAHALEHAHAVVQGMGQHVHLGLAPRHQFPIQPDQTVAVVHCHRPFSTGCLKKSVLPGLEAGPPDTDRLGTQLHVFARINHARLGLEGQGMDAVAKRAEGIHEEAGIGGVDQARGR